MTLSTWECALYLPIELELVTYTIAGARNPNLAKQLHWYVQLGWSHYIPKVHTILDIYYHGDKKTVVKFSLQPQYE